MGERSERLPYLLTAYGIPYTMGYVPDRAGAPNPAPRNLMWLADFADSLGLSGIEAPIGPVVASFQGTIVSQADHLQPLASSLTACGLSLVSDYGALLDRPSEDLAECLRRSCSANARVVRVLLSHALCGDRRGVDPSWREHLAACAARLREVAPLARDLGLCIAVENHQDATSADLLWLMEAAGEPGVVGVCLDTGNPLAVAEGPAEAAVRLAPFIVHCHLKDYRVHRYAEGYRLCRCANGDGVVNFAEVLKAVRSNGALPSLGIEIAAQRSRDIAILAPWWWSQHAAEQAAYLPEALRYVWDHLQPMEEPWQSAWEQGITGEALVHEELNILKRSVEGMRGFALEQRLAADKAAEASTHRNQQG